MTMLWQDLRYALRMLIKNTGFSVVAVLTLALGIGTNTAIFSVVNAVLLRPLPFRDPDRLCFLYERLPVAPILGPSYLNFIDIRDQNTVFEGVASVHAATFTLTGAGEPERLTAQMASANFYPLMGVSALQGRTFLPEEDRAGGPAVVLITYGFWQRQFNGSPDAIGKSLTLDNQSYNVIGILPAGFQFLNPVDVMVPFAPWARGLPDDRSWHPGITAAARLKPGVTLEQARVELDTIAERLEKQYPVYDTDMGLGAIGMHDQLVQNVRPALLVLLGAVGLVLLIACGNIANLLLARSSARTQEIAVRMAIGAGRGRILRQLLTESVLLAFAGAAFGLFIAWLAMSSLVSLAASAIPNVGPIALDGKVLAFSMGLALFAGILFGLAPALQTAKLDLRGILNDASRGTTGGTRRQQFRNLLVVAEVALALILLVGAGLLIRSFERLQDVSPGFQPANLLVADVPLSPRAYPRAPQRMEFFDHLLERARAIPGVTSAGAATFLPVSGGGSIIHFNIEGRPPKTAHDYIAVGYRPVSPAYLQTLRVPLLQGRLLAESDTETTEFVVVVNDAMARQFFPGESPLGKHIQIGGIPNDEVPKMRIIGVVGSMKQNLATDSASEIYLPYRQANSILPVFSLSVVLRAERDPRAQVSALRTVVHDLDPNQPVIRFRTMEENIATSVSAPRFRTVLLGIFAMSALLLSIVGLYGLMAYSVSQRVHEIGIRVTLGAQRSDVLRLIVGQGLKLALWGAVVGLAGAFALSRLLKTFLFSVSATDPGTFAAVAFTLVAVALLASYIPARRATRVDPVVALRYE
jgi:putative ABC transport system permease protein